MILIDNYDSFTYNIVQYLKELGIEPKIFKNDEITVEELKNLSFSSIVISPGPGNPNTAGICLDVIKEFYKTKKILGVCLGHQCIAQFFGSKIIQAKEPFHGKTSKIYFEQDKLFKGIKQGFEATRYHSLIVDSQSIPDCIKSLAFTLNAGGIVIPPYDIHNSLLMALKHKDYPLYGVQFHPEAILTQYGKKLLLNFINM